MGGAVKILVELCIEFGSVFLQFIDFYNIKAFIGRFNQYPLNTPLQTVPDAAERVYRERLFQEEDFRHEKRRWI